MMINRAIRYTAGALRNVLVGFGALIFCGAVVVMADYLFTPGTTSTMFAFTCFTTKVCPAHVNIDSSGTALPALNVGTNSILATDYVTVQTATQYPGISTPIGNAASGTTGAVVATLAAAANQFTYLCEFEVSAIGGTAAVGPVTIAGVAGGSRVVQLSSTATGVYLTKDFSHCLQSSSTNTAITITTTADGTASAVNVNASGFQNAN